MSKAEFLEYTYANAVTHELMSRYDQAIYSGRIKRSSVVAVVDIPSLIDEALVGYDVMFPFDAVPLCYQYKISEPQTNIQRANLTKGGFPGPLEDPSYYFQIKRTQNDTLIRLAKNIMVKVFYCAPKFDRLLQLNRHVLNRHVLRNSFLLKPPDLTGTDKTHKVVFDLKRHHYICSEPKELDGVYDFPELLEQLRREKTPVLKLLETILERLRADLYREAELWDQVDSSLSPIRSIEDDRYMIQRAAVLYRWIKLIVSLYYGADFLLL